MRQAILIASLVVGLGAYGAASASLIDRGMFDDGHGGTIRLVYDDDLDVTWLGDANFAKSSGYDADGLMTWDEATPWAASLRVAGLDGWRLPTTPQFDSSCEDASGRKGFECRGSEMGHLFYDELSGQSRQSILLSGDPDLSLFVNIQADPVVSRIEFYWSSSPASFSGTDHRFGFLLFDGSLNYGSNEAPNYAWAVRDGDVRTAPEPASLALLALGIFGACGAVQARKTGAWSALNRGLSGAVINPVKGQRGSASPLSAYRGR